MLFHPIRFARGTMLPDRWGRAVRWACFHIMWAAASAALLGNQRYFFSRVYEYGLTEGYGAHPGFSRFRNPPLSDVASWFGLSMLSWILVLTAPVILASTIAFGSVGQHRAVKHGATKTALYMSALLPWLVWSWHIGGTMVAVLDSPADFKITLARDVFIGLAFFSVDSLAPVTSATAYAAWWTVGVCFHPYQFHRRLRGFLRYAVFFGLGWLLIAKVLLRPGILADLL